MNFLIGVAAGVFGGLVGLGGGVVGAWTHWQKGHVGKNILRGLIPGIVLGTIAGAGFAHLLVETGLRILFVAVLIWTGVRFAFKPTTPTG